MNTFGLIGFPLGHSFSKAFFTDKFDKENIHAQYLNFELKHIADLEQVLQEQPNLIGFNITIPYKEEIISRLSSLSPEAQAIGAVNVVKIKYNQGKTELIGHNSDVYGFVESLRPMLQSWHKKALVLGTGGASKAIVYGLQSLGIHTQQVSRNRSNKAWSYQDITYEILCDYKLIVNCTPLGMYPNVENKPLLPYGQLTDQHLLYDLVYNPEVTAFLSEGIKHKAAIKNGLEMLHLQALKAWEIWNTNED